VLEVPPGLAVVPGVTLVIEPISAAGEAALDGEVSDGSPEPGGLVAVPRDGWAIGRSDELSDGLSGRAAPEVLCAPSARRSAELLRKRARANPPIREAPIRVAGRRRANSPKSCRSASTLRSRKDDEIR
jgi:hypothetical protein